MTRTWSPCLGPDQAQVVTAKEERGTHTAKIADQDRPHWPPRSLGAAFRSRPCPRFRPAQPGRAADAGRVVITDRRWHPARPASTAADKLATSVAEHLASTFAEAEGLAVEPGDPGRRAGHDCRRAQRVRRNVDRDQRTARLRRDPRRLQHPFWVSGRADRTLTVLPGQRTASRTGFPGWSVVW